MNPRTTFTSQRTHTCFRGPECSWVGAGHAMAFEQDLEATADRDGWQDTVVKDVSAGGWISLTTLDGRPLVQAWTHTDVGEVISPGDPVSVHGDLHVLAAGEHRFNVLLAGILA